MQTLRAGLELFNGWAAMTEGTGGTRGWMLRPLFSHLDDVATLVASRLEVMIDSTSNSGSEEGSRGQAVGGHDARVLLAALHGVHVCLKEKNRHNPTALRFALASVPEVIRLRARCVDILLRSGQAPLPPAVHLLAVASLEIILRAQLDTESDDSMLGSDAVATLAGEVPSEPSHTTCGVKLVIALLQGKLEGRIASKGGGSGEPCSRLLLQPLLADDICRSC